jgi:hypothetical protein
LPVSPERDFLLCHRSGNPIGNDNGAGRTAPDLECFMKPAPLLRAAAAFLALGVVPGLAGDVEQPVGVVELFTSQGCSSCPPADEVLAELARSGEVVALGYHVDYWDYLGWKDTLGRSENTARQYDYGKSFGSRSVYTPQAVINGRRHVNGAKRQAVQAALAEMRTSGAGLTVDIDIQRSGDSILIDAHGAPDGRGSAHLVLVYFDPTRPIVIERGENKGRTIRYANPVTGLQTVGMWHGRPVRFEFPQSEVAKKGGCAVLLQSVSKDGLPGPILGAALIRRPKR